MLLAVGFLLVFGSQTAGAIHPSWSSRLPVFSKKQTMLGLNLNAAAVRRANLRTAFENVATNFDPTNGGQPVVNADQTRFLTQFSRKQQPGMGDVNSIQIGHALCLPTTPGAPATLAALADGPL